MHDVTRNNASMDAKHQEEKQSLQAQLAQLSRNMQEEEQIAIARISAKVHPRDNEISELQVIREKHDKMMRQNPITPPVCQQSFEPGKSPPGRPTGPPTAGKNRFKKPPDSSDPGPPASESGRPEGRRRWGGPPGGPDPDPQDPPGRAPDRNTDSNITLPALPSPPGFHLHPVSIRRFPSFRTQPLGNLSIDSVKNHWGAQ